MKFRIESTFTTSAEIHDDTLVLDEDEVDQLPDQLKILGETFAEFADMPDAEVNISVRVVL